MSRSTPAHRSSWRRWLQSGLVGDFSPTYPSDAYYLRQTIVSWLVKRFAEVETNSFLISSLATTYGDPAVGQLLQALQPTSNIGVLSQITGKALDVAGLDWRDFLTWRLVLENELITRQDQTDFLELYDPSMRDQAIARYNAGGSTDQRTVISAIPEQVNGTCPTSDAGTGGESGDLRGRSYLSIGR